MSNHIYLGGAVAILDHSDIQIIGTNFTGNKAETLFNVITNPNCPQGNYYLCNKAESIFNAIINPNCPQDNYYAYGTVSMNGQISYF